MKPEDKIIELIENFFKKYGIKYSQNDNYSTWLLHYFNFRLKYIGVCNREVYLSEELKESSLDNEFKIALNAIIDKATHGIDLNPYQSKQSFNSDYDDGLFNDWGIHHLHLSVTKKNRSDYFMKRSSKLLFVKFTDSQAYLIDIYEHNEKPLWGKRDLIRKIRNNWPELLKDKEVGYKFTPDLTDDEIETVRKKGYLFGINVDDIGYLLLGHGQASSGDNIMAGRMSDEVIRWLGANKDYFYSDNEKFISSLKEQLFLN